MPNINIFRIGATGVDMKSHPLSLGPLKLHSAVNMAFDEGVCRTRPGFHYHSLGVAGQFQGATLFTPSLGISSQSFADPLAGLVTAAGGKVFVNDTIGGICGRPMQVPCSEDFSCRGEVNMASAENYLIIQNAASNTHWWTGNGDAVESPGMAGDIYWLDPVPPKVCFTPPEPPVANIPECDKFPCEFDACTLELLDFEVHGANSASFRIVNSGTAAAVISSFNSTPSTGVSFVPPSLTIEAGTDAEVEIISSVTDISVDGLTVDVANSCGTGEFEFEIPGSTPEPPCDIVILSIVTLTSSTATVVLQNTGGVAVGGILVQPVGPNPWSFTPSLPGTVLAGEVLEIAINALGTDIQGVPFTITTDCSTTTIISDVIPTIPEGCSIEVVLAPGGPSGTVHAFNNGSVPVTISSVVPSGNISLAPPGFPSPVIIGPGYGTDLCQYDTAMPHSGTISVANTCTDPIILSPF